MQGAFHTRFFGCESGRIFTLAQGGEVRYTGADFK